LGSSSEISSEQEHFAEFLSSFALLGMVQAAYLGQGMEKVC